MAGIRPSQSARCAQQNLATSTNARTDNQRTGQEQHERIRSRAAQRRGRRHKNIASKIIYLANGVFAFILVTVGIALLLTPYALHTVAAEHAAGTAQTFSQQASEFADSKATKAAIDKAEQMNQAIAAQEQPDISRSPSPYEYRSWEGASDEGVIAVVSSPAIELALPVYRDVADQSLARGTGHMPGSSLPIGGASTRCVLVGHTAYKDIELFDRISNLQQGDLVFITSVAGTLAYQVIGSCVIDPHDYAALSVVPDHDMLTLLTCTPPKVNSHRLAVDCERVKVTLAPNNASDAGEATEPPPTIDEVALSPIATHNVLPARLVVVLIALGSLCSGALVCTLALFLPTRVRRKQQRALALQQSKAMSE